MNLSIVRGTSNVFGLVVTDADGDPFIIESGQRLIFGVKKRPKDKDCIFTKGITHQVETGTYYLELQPADTADLEPGKYFYDVGLQHGDSVFYNVIEANLFEIKPNITKLGDGV